METTTGLAYIGATDRAAAEAYENWVAAGRPVQLALPFRESQHADWPQR